MSKTATLPAKNSKDEDNVIEITNKKLDEKIDTGIKFTIPADKFEFTQFESLEEFVQEAGSNDRALEIINDLKRDVAASAGKNYIRTATKGTIDEIIAAGLSVTKTHSFSKSETLTGKEAKEGLLALKAEINNLSPAEIEAKLRQLLGV